MTFDEALECALAERTWTKQDNKWIMMLGIKECTQRQFEIIDRAAPKLEYYDEDKLLRG